MILPQIVRLCELGRAPVLVEVLPSHRSTFHPVRFTDGTIRQIDRRYLDAHCDLPARHPFPCSCVDCWALRWLVEHTFPDTFREDNHRAYRDGYEWADTDSPAGRSWMLRNPLGYHPQLHPYWYHGYRARAMR